MSDLRIRSKAQTYGFLVGIAAGCLLAGLVVPFAVGDATTDAVAGGATGGSFSSGGVDTADSATGTVGELDGAGGGAGAAGGGSTSGAAAGGSGPSGSTGAPGGAGDGAGAAGGASVPGARGGPAPAAPGAAAGEKVRVGILLLDIGNVSELGFPSVVSVEDLQKVWQHWIAELNAAGGVNGRQIEPVYKVYDPLSQESMREACIYLTEDQKVALAIAAGGFVGNPILCFTEEHRTPLIVAGSSGVPQEFYAKSNGLLFTTFMGSDRATQNLAAEVDQLGAMRGKTVGILFDLRSGPASIAERMKREVEALGHKVGRVSVFSADYGTAGGQVPVEVQQHRTAGVEVILNLSHALVFTQFVQQATSQNFRPPYFSFDWNGANSDFYYSNLPASFDGNQSFTIQRTNEWRANLPEQPVARACVDEAEEALGREIPHEDADFMSFARECAFFILMKHALGGADISGPSMSQALQAIGRIDLPAFGGTAFGPGRFEAGDHVRTLTWKADCKCVIPTSGFRPAKY